MTIEFANDGTAHAFYDEAIDLAALGRMTVRRVTAIEFNEATQMWEVWPSPKSGLMAEPFYTHRLRSACVQWERENLI